MKRVKVLHTADWHLGKLLHKYSLEEDQQLFLDWLAALVREREIDLLLVSGDIFDTAYPSSTALSRYYRFLTGLVGNKCKIVITGGNHDSPGVLNAPREILRHLDIRIVGSIPQETTEMLFPFDELGIVVAAVPFLREADLRKSVSGQGFEDRVAMVRQGIQRCYENVVIAHRKHFPAYALIGMGHLHVGGVDTSESEREIHIVGNLAAFNTEHFPEGFEYMALGHIHKPQKLSERIRYSGSPIPLSFSERSDPKFVLELDFEEGRLVGTSAIPVPRYRELRTLSGTIDEVWNGLSAFRSDNPLEALVELAVSEPYFDPEKSLRFDNMLREFGEAPFRIIKPRLTFENRKKEAAELFTAGTEVADLSPMEVFQKRLENETLEEETRDALLQAFGELLAGLDASMNPGV